MKQKWIMAGLVMAVAGGLVIERVVHKGGSKSEGSSPAESGVNTAGSSENKDGASAVGGGAVLPGKGGASEGAAGSSAGHAGAVAGGAAAGVAGGAVLGGGGEKASESKPSEVADAHKPSTGCESLTFAVKGAQKFSQNLLKLPKGDGQTPNLDSVCVKADGLPVRFSLDKKKMEITLGAVRKADSRVTVSYCVGKAKCGDPCVVPRDEFMEALAGGDDEQDDAQNAAGWADAGSKEEQELDKQLAGFNLSDERVKGVNSAWTVENRSDACDGRVAKK